MRCGLISANRLYWTWPCRVTGIPTAMVCSAQGGVEQVRDDALRRSGLLPDRVRQDASDRGLG